jgi:hypothetical protein
VPRANDLAGQGTTTGADTEADTCLGLGVKIKAELCAEQVEGRYEDAFVVDDRNQVVRMWRDELGLTVLQWADGDF